MTVDAYLSHGLHDLARARAGLTLGHEHELARDRVGRVSVVLLEAVAALALAPRLPLAPITFGR
jgi:hypothetical protein